MNKRIKDEELQKIIFEAVFDDKHIFEEGEAGYYRTLKKALETMPKTDLPEVFAQQVTKKAMRRKYVYDIFRTATLHLGAAFIFLSFGGFALFFLAKDVFHFLMDGVEGYKYPIAFGLLVFVLVQMLDELFVQKKTAKFKQ